MVIESEKRTNNLESASDAAADAGLAAQAEIADRQMEELVRQKSEEALKKAEEENAIPVALRVEDIKKELEALYSEEEILPGQDVNLDEVVFPDESAKVETAIHGETKIDQEAVAEAVPEQINPDFLADYPSLNEQERQVVMDARAKVENFVQVGDFSKEAILNLKKDLDSPEWKSGIGDKNVRKELGKMISSEANVKIQTGELSVVRKKLENYIQDRNTLETNVGFTEEISDNEAGWFDEFNQKKTNADKRLDLMGGRLEGTNREISDLKKQYERLAGKLEALGVQVESIDQIEANFDRQPIAPELEETPQEGTIMAKAKESYNAMDKPFAQEARDDNEWLASVHNAKWGDKLNAFFKKDSDQILSYVKHIKEGKGTWDTFLRVTGFR